MRYYTDFIWFFWEILLKEAIKKYDQVFNNQIQGLYKLFKYVWQNNK